MTDSPSRILLFGAKGQVGSALRGRLASLGHVIALGRADVDLRNERDVRDAIRRHAPAMVVNAAAWTAVDAAEASRDEAFLVNARAPAVMAEECAARNAWLVHFSTDYVFDGAHPLPYTELDAANPLSTYGESKLAGDLAVERTVAEHLIIRTSWVASDTGAGFAARILRLAEERDELRVVADCEGAPISAATLADATTNVVAGRLAGEGAWGLYHLTASGRTSWYDYARRILARAAGRSDRFRRPALEVVPVASAEYPALARRPRNSLLCTDKVVAAFSLTLPTWEEEIDVLVDHLVPGVTR